MNTNNNILSYDDIIYNVSNYLTIKEQLIFNSTFNNNIIKKCIRKSVIKYKIFNIMKKYKLINLFEGSFIPTKLISNIPVLKYKKSFARGTDYIDRIRPHDMSKPIMIGVDSYQRPYVCIKYKCINNPYTNINTEYEYVITFFQRHTGSKEGWVKAGHNTGPIINYSNVLLDDLSKKMILKNIYQLINDEEISYIKYKGNVMYSNEYDEVKINCNLIN